MIEVFLSNTRRDRKKMVRRQIAGRGLTNGRVLAAMASVPRERFVPEDVRHLAHADQRYSSEIVHVHLA